jgi:hypothetical protein
MDIQTPVTNWLDAQYAQPIDYEWSRLRSMWIAVSVLLLAWMVATLIYHSTRAYALWRIDKYGFETMATYVFVKRSMNSRTAGVETTALETSQALRGGGTVRALVNRSGGNGSCCVGAILRV